jgi:hypothetical protein
MFHTAYMPAPVNGSPTGVDQALQTDFIAASPWTCLRRPTISLPQRALLPRSARRQWELDEDNAP